MTLSSGSWKRRQRTQILGEATLELLELQRRAEDKMMDLEGRARRANVRIHGI